MDRKAERDEATRQHTNRALHVYPAEDGTVTIRGRLSPEAGALLMKVLAAAREALHRPERAEKTGAERVNVSSEAPTMAQQQADALQLVAETALHHGIDPGTSAEHYQVVVHVDAAVLEDADQPGQSVVEDGQRVSAETSQRLACDASRVVMRHDADGRIFEVGAKTRTIPPALRRALLHRDRNCRFPGCHGHFCQAHHIRHWAQGGPTTLSNLALLCRRHHRAVHEEGYQVDRQPDGELRFRRPDGCVVPDVPCPREAPPDPASAVTMHNDEAGIVVGPRTATPTWQGERLDVGYAIDVLHPLALGEVRSPAVVAPIWSSA
jgi:5-methylcytosine-specific restriction endonuclease McrA